MLQSDGFNGKGGKGDYGWLQGEVLHLNPILLLPVLERRTSSNLKKLV